MNIKKNIGYLILKDNDKKLFFDWEKNLLDLLIIFFSEDAVSSYFFPFKQKSYFKEIYHSHFLESLDKKKLLKKLKNNQIKIPDALFAAKIWEYLYLTLSKEILERNFGKKIVKKITYQPQNIIEKELFTIVKKRGYLKMGDLQFVAQKLNFSREKIRNVYYKHRLLLPYKTKQKQNQETTTKLWEEAQSFLVENDFKQIHPKYWINKKGNVYKWSSRGLKKVQQLLRKNNHNSFYFQVSVGGKHLFLHRILAKTFIANPNKYRYVRMKNNNFLDIRLDNIEWIKYPAITRIKNNLFFNKLTWLKFIKDNFVEGISLSALAEIIAKKAEELQLFNGNKNRQNTVHTVIKKHSQINSEFHVFTIRKDLNNAVFWHKKND